MTALVVPRWTEKLYTPSGGLDHLGVESVASSRILPRLLPGVNVLTVHPRYWSFYTWLLWEFWRDEARARDRASFSRFLRPREAIFAAGAAALCPNAEHDSLRAGVIGARAARVHVRRNPDALDSTYKYLDNSLGGYGSYYATAIAFMGVVFPGGTEGGPKFDIPNGMGEGGPGEKVALAFKEAVEDTRYYREFFADDEAVVPVGVVTDYIARACLCQLRTDSAPDRAPLRDVFAHAGAPTDAARRR